MTTKKTETAPVDEPEDEFVGIENLAIWDEVEKTNPDYTKSYSGSGGFKGTATTATYLVKKATKMFGPIGIGWGWDIAEEALMTGAKTTAKDGVEGTEVIHKIKLLLWYKWKGERGEISQFGQTTFVGKNKYGWYTDEEAPKKSLTDAMGKCLSLLGFAADIHLGMYDDNKYVRNLRDDFRDGDEFEARRRDREPKQEAAKDNVVPLKSEPKGQADDGDGKPQMTDEEFAETLKDEIQSKENQIDISNLMNSTGMKKDIKSLPADLATDVKEFAKAHLKKKMSSPKTANEN
jgi:hypothetical protein